MTSGHASSGLNEPNRSRSLWWKRLSTGALPIRLTSWIVRTCFSRTSHSGLFQFSSSATVIAGRNDVRNFVRSLWMTVCRRDKWVSRSELMGIDWWRRDKWSSLASGRVCFNTFNSVVGHKRLFFLNGAVHRSYRMSIPAQHSDFFLCSRGRLVVQDYMIYIWAATGLL